MQSLILKFRQSYCISKKPGYLSENLKKFDELQLPEGLILFAEILHTFLPSECLQKDVWDFFYFV